MIDIVTNNVKQIGTPADEGRVYISEKAYKRIKTEGFKDKEVFVLMGHTESSGGRYATFVEAAIAVYDMEFDKNAPLWTNKVWSRVFAEIRLPVAMTSQMPGSICGFRLSLYTIHHHCCTPLPLRRNPRTTPHSCPSAPRCF